jgi:hypothetical protein
MVRALPLNGLYYPQYELLIAIFAVVVPEAVGSKKVVELLVPRRGSAWLDETTVNSSLSLHAHRRVFFLI